MRAKFTLPCLLAFLVCVIVLVETQPGASQPPCGKGKGKGGFGDPGERFDTWMDKEKKGYIVISEQRFGKEAMELYAKDNNITNGKLTRDQFISYSAKATDYMQKAGIDFKGKGKGNKGGGNTPPAPGEAPKPKVTVGDESDVDKKAEESFTKYDTNGDGFLNEEEINKNTKKFKDEWKKWDDNKDGMISLSEYKTYFRDFIKRINERFEAKKQANEENRSGDKSIDTTKPGGIKRILIEEDEEVLPTTYHAGGKLPEGVPSWFTDYDTDKDGQVSFYEWRMGKKGTELELFEKMDRNDDGFLTVEEVLHYQRQTAAPARTATNQVTIISSNRPDQPNANTRQDFMNKKGKCGGKKGKKGPDGG